MDATDEVWQVRKLIVDDVVLLVSSSCDIQLTLETFAVKREAVGMRINTSKFQTMVLSKNRVECPLQGWDEVFPQVEEFEYFRVLSTNDGIILTIFILFGIMESIPSVIR